MKILWKWDFNSEAQRIIHTAHQIIINFYQKNNFYILPFKKYKYLCNGENIVYFPKINTKKINNFWKKVKNVNISVWPLIKNKYLINYLINYLKNDLKLKPINNEKLINSWKKIEKKVIKTIFYIFNNKKDKIKKIIIYPTYFGTSLSFNNYEKNNNEIKIFLRCDQKPLKIIEGILSSLLTNDLIKNYHASWRERELIIDFLIQNTRLYSLIKTTYPNDSFYSTTKIINRNQINTRLKKKTISFLKEIGIFSLNSNNNNIYNKLFSIYINKKKLTNLTWKERRVLKLFKEKKDDIVSFEDISNIIFRKNEEEYSLFAIYKFMSRLRKKLKENNIDDKIIETVRKKGFVLNLKKL